MTIEKRLANGYYKRPKDFLADIKKLTKDARTLGDQERLLKAQELQANVEVDVTDIEMQSPSMVAEWEGVYRRELERKKAGLPQGQDTSSDEAAAQPRSPLHLTASTSLLNNSTNNQIIGEAVNGTQQNRPSEHSSLTNGISDLSNLGGPHQKSNSNSNRSNHHDVHMTNSDDTSTPHGTQNSSFGPSAQTRPLHFHTGGPTSLQQRASFPGSLSQKGIITPMAEGSNPAMYENSASTTSSDKRMTGSSGPLTTPSAREAHSGPKESQGSGGRFDEGPDISMLLNHPFPNSQLPDTQGIFILPF